jgi:hypothetical protein
MSRPGTLAWRCRLCSEVIRGDHVDDIYAHLAGLIDAPKKSARIGTHACRHGATGVTDLCGANPDIEDPSR